MRVDEFEKVRLEKLSGSESVGDFLLGLAFRVKHLGTPDNREYPGWEIVERNRRDGGIMIKKEPTPMGRKSPVVLYPEDKEYARFSKL